MRRPNSTQSGKYKTFTFDCLVVVMLSYKSTLLKEIRNRTTDIPIITHKHMSENGALDYKLNFRTIRRENGKANMCTLEGLNTTWMKVSM